MRTISIMTPLDERVVKRLSVGDKVLISGVIYTARDAAHIRLINTIERGDKLPIKLAGQIIYYVGPAPAKPGQVIGACGPTTSYRMDSMSPALIARDLRGMIGKGTRDQAVIDAMTKYGAIYFAAIGGAGALIAQSVVDSEVLCYDDLGPEAIHRLTVKDFPAIVVIDAKGNNLYQTARARYAKSLD